VTAASLDEATALFVSDPAVNDGIFVHDIAEFAPFYPGTVGQPPTPKGEGPARLPGLELPPDLARILTDYEKAWRARDAPGLAALFAEDGFVLPSGRPPVHGREAIQRHYTGQGGALSLRAFAYQIGESSGYILGGYASRPGVGDTGKFTLTLTRTPGGQWLILSDMDNGNAQP